MHQNQPDAVCQPVPVGVVPTPRSPFSWDEESWHYAMTAPAQEEPASDAALRDHRDLCCICTYAAQCMHCGTASRPKLHCELFDVDVKTFAASEDCRATSVAGRSAAPDAARGLCCNCENRKHCVIRAREGAIWHCEEYC